MRRCIWVRRLCFDILLRLVNIYIDHCIDYLRQVGSLVLVSFFFDHANCVEHYVPQRRNAVGTHPPSRWLTE